MGIPTMTDPTSAPIIHCTNLRNGEIIVFAELGGGIRISATICPMMFRNGETAHAAVERARAAIQKWIETRAPIVRADAAPPSLPTASTHRIACP
jgi:hypothetical protein